ncbi:metallophosphoesterase [Leptotrichia trevisanii]|uniref:metallophosphoesterase family protein n=1 Tax=Leptotrichia trevisanii TaxID=109328 RepID=UPI0011896597|nr:metallophosphoesterase family protein [Leptotrichia trevisanii]BBM57808.1 metallophosphoesterase [Leptotrichia trevisanii]
MESEIKTNKIKIEKINESDYNRIFIMSDIHGQYDLFLKMLGKIDLKREDLLVIMGDVCDRGEKSYEIYMKCMKMIKLGYNLKFILGNHEDMLLEDLENDYPIRYETEYSVFRNSKYFDKKNMKNWHEENFRVEIEWLVEWLKNCPLIIFGNKNIFVHAGLDLQTALKEQERETVLWTRKEFWLMENVELEEYRGKNIYFGHTPNINGRISQKTDKISGIDCGAFFTHFLGCVEVKSKEEIYVYKDECIQFSEVLDKVFMEVWNEEVADFIDSEKYKIKSGKRGIEKIKILKKLDRKEKEALKKFVKKYERMFGKNVEN